VLADFVGAAERTTLVTAALIGAAFALSHLLPRAAREQSGTAAGEPIPA
jgi:hypothetical protein